jgi:hypothetical protein
MITPKSASNSTTVPATTQFGDSNGDDASRPTSGSGGSSGSGFAPGSFCTNAGAFNPRYCA